MSDHGRTLTDIYTSYLGSYISPRVHIHRKMILSKGEMAVILNQ